MRSTTRPRPQERPWPAPRGPNAPRRAAATERRSRPTADRTRTPTAQPSGSGSSQAAERSNASAGRQAGIGQHARAGRLRRRLPSSRSGPSTSAQDIASLPWITIHTKAIWLPVLITIGATIATAVTGANDMVTGLLFTYFVVFPAIGGVFIGGFLAPRASWLLGVVVGLVSAVCYVASGRYAACCRRRSPSSSRLNATRCLGLGIHLLADHGRVLRRRRGLVSTLPRRCRARTGTGRKPVAGPEAATRRRPDAAARERCLRRPRAPSAERVVVAVHFAGASGADSQFGQPSRRIPA